MVFDPPAKLIDHRSAAHRHSWAVFLVEGHERSRGLRAVALRDTIRDVLIDFSR
jgi:hypothetical protein